MDSTIKQTLIVSLIRDDLLNTHLVNGLNNLGIQASPYFLHLSETIFQLMEFEDNEETDEVYMHYLELTKETNNIHVSHSHEQFELLALDIYKKLLKKKLRG